MNKGQQSKVNVKEIDRTVTTNKVINTTTKIILGDDLFD
jgi:hypothetical protein